MNLLRNNWYDLGGVLAVLVGIYICFNDLTNYQILMWLSLVSLFLHQLEEYRIVGTFPGMINSVVFNSKSPERFPLNANTAFYVNVVVGWTSYFLAAVFAERAIWLGMATIMVSVGNTIAHTTLFNIKGRTVYNAGMATSWLLFAPCAYFFFSIIHSDNLATMADYFIGILFGVMLNVVGILKLIEWMADEKSPHVFYERNLLKKDRKIQ